MSEAEYENLKVKAVDCKTFNIIGDGKHARLDSGRSLDSG
jgi:hypothetical protein